MRFDADTVPLTPLYMGTCRLNLLALPHTMFVSAWWPNACAEGAICSGFWVYFICGNPSRTAEKRSGRGAAIEIEYREGGPGKDCLAEFSKQFTGRPSGAGVVKFGHRKSGLGRAGLVIIGTTWQTERGRAQWKRRDWRGRLYEAMKEAGLRPSRSYAYALVRAFRDNDRPELAAAYAQELEANGIPLRPSMRAATHAS